SLVIIVRLEDQTIGLLVGELHGVPEFQSSQIIPTPLAAQENGMLVKQVIKANDGKLLIQAVDVESLFAVLNDRSEMNAPADSDYMALKYAA
ncbi:MAG: chemotaxis protein CheW, partial [Burkholderiaceae bacterium]